MENTKVVYEYDSNLNLKIERNCKNCEFNAGNRCMGEGRRIDNGAETYGMPLSETTNMFPNGCDDFGISYMAYVNASVG
ncbi:hypothetical protein SAMN05216390_1295 [Lachnospiraceae bacterium KH1T2]|nr:hypothetical protein SAMN05216390_1295 [Lachnospiraceae bacterium KH1T2]